MTTTAITQPEREEWRDILGYDGVYQVSNYGAVRSFINSHRVRLSEPRLLKGQVTKKGYLQYHLMLDGHKKGFTAHRLVAAAFLGASDLQVNHKDGDRLNNFVGNLEYCTNSENQIHSFRVLGRKMPRGEKSPRARVSDSQVEEILRLLAQGVSGPTIADMFGISSSHVSSIKRGWSRSNPDQVLPSAASGERHYHAKVTDAQVVAIHQLAADGVSNRDIAQRYGITANHVSRIKRGVVRVTPDMERKLRTQQAAEIQSTGQRVAVTA